MLLRSPCQCWYRCQGIDTTFLGSVMTKQFGRDSHPSNVSRETFCIKCRISWNEKKPGKGWRLHLIKKSVDNILVCVDKVLILKSQVLKVRCNL